MFKSGCLGDDVVVHCWEESCYDQGHTQRDSYIFCQAQFDNKDKYFFTVIVVIICDSSLLTLVPVSL